MIARKRFVMWTFCVLMMANIVPLFSQSGEGTGYTLKTVVIDAGHGGKDPGAIGASGTKEKDIALNVALLVGKYIKENLPDVTVVYTRDDDTFVPLFERGAIANEHDGQLFISIHADAFTSSSVTGTEVFALGLHKSQENLEVAKRENASILMESDYLEKYGGYDPNSPESIIMLTMGVNANLDQSLLFASKVEKQFVTRVNRSSRGVKQAGFVVLHQSAMPSVLIELGFISNRNEETFLKSKEGQTYMASAIYRAFKEYKYEVEGLSVPLDDEDPKLDESNLTEEKKEKNPPKTEVIATDNKTATETGNQGLVYKVQFMALPKVVTSGDPSLKGITNFETEKVGEGTYRYLSGSYISLKEATNHQTTIRAKGFSGAFVSPYFNGNRITMTEAKKIESGE